MGLFNPSLSASRAVRPIHDLPSSGCWGAALDELFSEVLTVCVSRTIRFTSKTQIRTTPSAREIQ